MKNLIFTMTAGLLLLTGCSKDQSFELNEAQNPDPIFIMDQSDNTTVKNNLSTTDLYVDGKRPTTIDPTVYAYTEGNFTSTNRDQTTIIWTGTESNNRSTGKAEVKMSTPNYNLHFVIETECVRVDGKEAVYGGKVIQVVQRSKNAPAIDINWRYYFKVIDEVEDYKSSGNQFYDKISKNRFLVPPRSPSLCNIPVKHRYWSTLGYENVQSPGFVIVN